MEAPATATLDEAVQWDRRPLSDAHPVARVQTPELDLMRHPMSRLMPMSPSMPLNDYRHSEHSTWANDFMLAGSYLPGGPMPDQARPARLPSNDELDDFGVPEDLASLFNYENVGGRAHFHG